MQSSIKLVGATIPCTGKGAVLNLDGRMMITSSLFLAKERAAWNNKELFNLKFKTK